MASLDKCAPVVCPLPEPRLDCRAMLPRSMQPRLLVAVMAPCLALLTACQDYPFDFRATSRVEAQRLNQLVATSTPVDILFMIDNSPTMREETDELKNNVELFVTALAAQKIDFQIG